MPRSPATSGYVAELDGLRGIAILLVMIHRMYPHAGGTPWPIEAGWIGVDLFFVISGFLIAGILIDTRDDPDYFRNFYARRVLRIFPLFYLLVGGMLLAFPLAGHPDFVRQAGSPLWYLLQLGNVPESLLGRDPPYWLTPVWSLAIEEQFYLTFPLLVRWSRPERLARWLVAAALLALGVRLATTALIPDRERLQYLFTLCRLDTIAIGCLLAVFVRSARYPAWRAALPRVLAPVLVGAIAVWLITRLDRTTWFGRTLGYDIVAIGFAALVLLVFERRDRASTAILRTAPLRYLGKRCFGLYLLHRPADTLVTALVMRAGLDDTSLAWLPVKIAAALALATVSWRLIEQPFLRQKRRFTSKARPRIARPAVIATTTILWLFAACQSSSSVDRAADAPESANVPGRDASDGAQPRLGRVVYAEGPLLSPIPPDLAADLATIATQAPAAEQVFGKIGDSITATTSFLSCFDGPGVDLGAHAALAGTLAYFQAGNADGMTPYGRISLAAGGGWTAADVLAGTPAALDRELTAIAPRYGLVLLGTNDVRDGRTVEAFGIDLWSAVDRLRARGAIPILSTLPALHDDPANNARIPRFNHVIRAIAQGRSLPLIDLHRALAALSSEGIGADGIHPTVAPEGACALTSTGLRYGYNLRNLLSLEALDRARRARNGEPLDASAPRRAGAGSHADPFRAELPLADMADTRTGEPGFASSPGCGLTASGRAIVYRLDLPAQLAIDAFVIVRAPVDVDVAILASTLAASSCVAAGDRGASATVGPGPVFIVVASRSPATEGELVVVVQAR
jgi:peptidoglycan/LPS O-acetylase OafA/YrhL